MIRLPDPRSASRWCAQQRARCGDDALGYVPTMGALHRGHLSLVERAARENRAVCASIFVNPLQFDDADDLRRYPRNEARDHDLLERAGCDMVYGGTLAEFFPESENAAANITVNPPDAIIVSDTNAFMRDLEGAHRRGHLQGVRAIVERLFATVGACNAYFGAKDFQQTLVVKDLARAFDGIRVVVCPTVREPSGLALSSRNQRLHADQLAVAAQLYQALLAARAEWRAGRRERDAIEAAMREILRDARITLEYVAVRDPETWDDIWENTINDTKTNATTRAIALVAARIGAVRLIDNLRLDDADQE
ncbi:MAG: pantoate--beta-alanine ligase [bacterium]